MWLLACRAGRAEARVAELEAATAALQADRTGLTARVAELAGQVAELQESVTTLSGLLFGSSSQRAVRPRGGTAMGLAGPVARVSGGSGRQAWSRAAGSFASGD